MDKSEELLRKTVKEFRSANHAHRRIVEQSLQETGVYRSQHQLLMYISRHLNQSQTEIAEGMEVTPATVAVSLKKLEKGGYIEKIVDENDNRFNKIEITEKGGTIVKDSIRIFQSIDKVMFQDFSVEELLQLQDFMIRIKKNLGEIDLSSKDTK
ncbi:MarR family winged helix-turn-helix transcriptional regulator [Clostridium sp. Marseille-P299]|uniref:MarR family winged helix-turn-helix transcriptional regulator n=1 Tax=Clostridium sp. Marseille-P299 TaxID=1805477 RepID=UPI0008303080|nr:MarR family transcriptional regulator [Clostridium sp. Marseille-P299]